jgi:hypothetical protein
VKVNVNVTVTVRLNKESVQCSAGTRTSDSTVLHGHNR